MESGKKKLAILGSTGSIGRQTLDVVRTHPEKFEVAALTAGSNLDLLAEQILEFHPQYISYTSRDKRLPPSVTATFLNPEDIVALPDVDTVVVASSGISALVPVVAAARAGKTVAMANKETLVMAGDFVMQAVSEGGASLFPVDSEHSAVWQCLQGEETFPSRIILTASGGPFRNYSFEQLEKVTPSETLKHPTWKMGRKITVDSATLVNKGFEVIEAHYLFDVPFNKIDVLVHPESIVHSMVEFPDGAVKAQLGSPDMRIPIQYALSYPERLETPIFPHLDFNNLKNLTFEAPDVETFPGLEIAISAGEKGGTYPAVLVGADEAAVALFLEGKIKFTDIPRLLKETIDAHSVIDSPAPSDLIFAERWAREKVRQLGA